MENVKYKVGDIVYSNISHNMVGRIAVLYDNNDGMVIVDGKRIYVNLKYWHKEGGDATCHQ